MNAVYDCMNSKLPMLADLTVERLGEVYDMSKPGQYRLTDYVQAVQRAQATCPEIIDSYQVLSMILANQKEFQNEVVVIDNLLRPGSYAEFEYTWGVKRIFFQGGYLVSADNVHVTRDRLLGLLTGPMLKELRVHDCIHTSGHCVFNYKEVQVNGRFV